jgi:hypothetical protein
MKTSILKRKRKHMRLKTISIIVSLLICAIHLQSQTTEPLKGWELNETNTGLAGVGIDKNTLPDCTLPVNPWGSRIEPAAGSVIHDVRINDPLDLSAGNITIERCWIAPAGINLYTGDIVTGWPSSGKPNIIRDCDIDGTVVTGADKNDKVCSCCAFSGNNLTVERCQIFGWGSGIAPYGYDTVRIEGNYIYGLISGNNGGDPTNPSHNETFTIRDYRGPSAQILNNRFVCFAAASTGEIFFKTGKSASGNPAETQYINNVFVEGNLMEGMGFNLILTWGDGLGYGANMRAVNNRFHPSGWGVGYVDGGPGWAEWKDNYLNDSSKLNNKGNLLAEFKPAFDSQVIAIPGNLQAVSASTSKINLTWNDNSNNEIGFRIERSIDNNNFNFAAAVNANIASYSDTGLTGNTIYYYRVIAYHALSGMAEVWSGYSNTASVKTTSTTVSASTIPNKFSVSQNYPNPFNPSTKIQFVVPSDGHVRIRVCNCLGQIVATPFDGEAKAGQYQAVQIDGTSLSSGVYFYSVEHRGQRITKQMVLIK